MYRKDYRNYIELLRSREARPAFLRMEALVAAAPTRGRAVIPFFAKLVSALAISGIIAAGYWALAGKFHTAQMQPRNNHENSIVSHVSHGTHRSYGGESPMRTSGLQKVVGLTKSEEILQSLPKSATLTACALPEHALPHSTIAANAHPIPPIALSDSEKEMDNYFFATIGGALSQQFSSSTAFRQFSFSDAFLGIGYDLSQNSSVRILAGEEVFNAPSNTTTNTISFQNKTFVHNGQTYQNVIGVIQSANIPVLTRIYWLGASYRYTLGDATTPMRLFAEVMAAGSANGFLSHQSLGAEMTISNKFDLDLQFQASELLPQNSSVLTKAGFAAELSYRW